MERGVQRLQCGNRNGVRGAVARECSAVIIQLHCCNNCVA